MPKGNWGHGGRKGVVGGSTKSIRENFDSGAQHGSIKPASAQKELLKYAKLNSDVRENELDFKRVQRVLNIYNKGLAEAVKNNDTRKIIWHKAAILDEEKDLKTLTKQRTRLIERLGPNYTPHPTPREAPRRWKK